jgi:EAL domain-containing protein (putative c-di-GMP-specific phosphodiesterase class I)
MYEIQEFINANRIEINTKQMPLNVTVALSNEAVQDLMTSCSMAMHQAKESRQKFKIFLHDTQITAQYQSNIEWTMRIQEAIKENLVIPFYQPIYETKTGEIKKYEALIRIKNEAEYARPCYFLDIAKKSNLYLDLSLCMLQKVFETIKTSPYTFSINLTYEDIENDQMRKYIYTQLQEADVAKRVIIEIVESEKLHNMNIANEFIHTVKRYGAQISIDDFGSGYSNFEYLLRLDADYIKIDGSLIKEIDKNIDSEDIVKTIVSFAKKKKIKTVAEFVSSKEIYEKIKKIDIDYMQGFYIGKPNSTLDILK